MSFGAIFFFLCVCFASFVMGTHVGVGIYLGIVMYNLIRPWARRENGGARGNLHFKKPQLEGAARRGCENVGLGAAAAYPLISFFFFLLWG